MRFELSPYALPDGYGDTIIPVAAAKAYLYVDHDDDDALIAALRDVAIDMTEKYNQVKLGEISGLVWRGECLSSPLSLGMREIRSIQSIDYLDSSGVATVMAVTDVRIGLNGQLVPAIGKTWPSDVGGAVEIEFTAGFATGTVPACLIAAAKMFMAQLYSNREDVIDGTSEIPVPRGFEMLSAQYRIPVI